MKYEWKLVFEAKGFHRYLGDGDVTKPYFTMERRRKYMRLNVTAGWGSATWILPLRRSKRRQHREAKLLADAFVEAERQRLRSPLELLAEVAGSQEVE